MSRTQQKKFAVVVAEIYSVLLVRWSRFPSLRSLWHVLMRSYHLQAFRHTDRFIDHSGSRENPGIDARRLAAIRPDRLALRDLIQHRCIGDTWRVSEAGIG